MTTRVFPTVMVNVGGGNKRLDVVLNDEDAGDVSDDDEGGVGSI